MQGHYIFLEKPYPQIILGIYVKEESIFFDGTIRALLDPAAAKRLYKYLVKINFNKSLFEFLKHIININIKVSDF